MVRRRWVVCYDVADDRRRRRIERALLGLGVRVQHSVFECRLGYAEARFHLGRLAAELDAETDSLRAYPLCVWCVEEVSILGGPRGREAREEQARRPVVVVL